MLRILTGYTVEHDWVFVAAAFVLGCGAALAAIVVLNRRGHGNGRLLALALNNMTQGVVMFDTAGRMVVCNDRYRLMYGLSADIVKPGARLIDIVRHRFTKGNLQRDDFRRQSRDTGWSLLGRHP
jgi:PAS domain-containing protein